MWLKILDKWTNNSSAYNNFTTHKNVKKLSLTNHKKSLQSHAVVPATLWLGIKQCSNQCQNLLPDKSGPRFSQHMYQKLATKNGVNLWCRVSGAGLRAEHYWLSWSESSELLDGNSLNTWRDIACRIALNNLHQQISNHRVNSDDKVMTAYVLIVQW